MRARHAERLLADAKARLDRLAFYPAPVRTRGVRVLHVAGVFRLPAMRRYHGYALWRTILLRDAPEPGRSDDLVTHELCHVWQGQHRRWHMLWTYAVTPYRENPYEREARRAVAWTRDERSN